MMKRITAAPIIKFGTMTFNNDDRVENLAAGKIVGKVVGLMIGVAVGILMKSVV